MSISRNVRAKHVHEPTTPLLEQDGAHRALIALLTRWTCVYRLSPSELEILYIAAIGDRSMRFISRVRAVKVATTKRQAQTLAIKLGVPGLAEAALMALRATLDDLSATPELGGPDGVTRGKPAHLGPRRLR